MFMTNSSSSIHSEPSPDDENELERRKSVGSPDPDNQGSWREYFLLRNAIDACRGQLASDGTNAADLARAEAAFSAAMRLLSPADPLPAAPSPYLALLLLREAAFWAFRSLKIPGDTLEAQIAEAPAALLASLAEAGEPQARARSLLLGSGREEALRPGEELERDARETTEIVRALVGEAAGPQRRLERLLFLRAIRSGVALGLLAGALGLAIWGLSRLTRPPELLAGKAWRASSSYKNYNPRTRVVDGNSTEIFFHTGEEINPWVEFDLARPEKVKSFAIQNRSDCCSERAVPLVIEVSQDRERWKEVARKNEDFSLWTGKIGPQDARFVRVRALRKTWLHLENVRVW
jgi:hypothetical protein